VDFLVIGHRVGRDLRRKPALSAEPAGGHGAGAVKMRDAMTVEVIMYLSQADKRHRWPLHSELAHQRVRTSHLVDAGGKLPVMLISLAPNGRANRFVPILKERTLHRPVVRAKVVLEQGTVG